MGYHSGQLVAHSYVHIHAIGQVVLQNLLPHGRHLRPPLIHNVSFSRQSRSRLVARWPHLHLSFYFLGELGRRLNAVTGKFLKQTSSFKACCHTTLYSMIINDSFVVLKSVLLTTLTIRAALKVTRSASQHNIYDLYDQLIDCGYSCKCLLNAKRPCDCRVLCLRLKSSLCSCAHSI